MTNKGSKKRIAGVESVRSAVSDGAAAGAPYRQPAERFATPQAARCWFTKSSDPYNGERGPYDAAALTRALRKGSITPSTLVRGEDETEWQPLCEVEALSSAWIVCAGCKEKVAAPREVPGFEPRGDTCPRCDEVHALRGTGRVDVHAAMKAVADAVVGVAVEGDTDYSPD